MTKIGYLGPPGSFSEEALVLFLQNVNDVAGDFEDNSRDIIPVEYSNITRVIEACEREEVDWAFVPLENSNEGQVSATLDKMMQSENLFIYHEFVHCVNECLLTPRPMPLNMIQRVYSHPQGLGQCREFLATHLSEAAQITTPSTADAARAIAGLDECWAAIAPKRAAELYGVYCHTENIQDKEENKTRFALIGHHLHEMSGEDKTSLLIGVGNYPGSLYEVLKEFAIRQINLTKIESRPSKEKLGEYVFFIDVEGYVFTPLLQEALWALKNNKIPVKLLGSYPKRF